MVKMLPSVTVVDNDHPYAPSSLYSGQFLFTGQRTGNLTDMIDCENFLDMVMEEIGRLVIVIDDLKQVSFEGINYDLGLLRLPKGAESPDAALLHQITQMNMLAHRLMSHDPARTGRIGTDIFRDFVQRMSRPVHGSVEPHLKFVAECVSRFRCGHSGDDVSYLDLWATLLSHLVQKDDFSGGWANNKLGYIETNFPVWAHAALLDLQRGLEENRASALVALLGYVPCETDEVAVVSNLGVPRIGSWAMHASSELPPELSGSGKFAVAAAKVVPESRPAAAPRGVCEVKSDPPGEMTLMRKATMREALHQPSVPKSQLQLQILENTQAERPEQNKAVLHPVILTLPLTSVSVGGIVADEEVTPHTHTKRKQTYAKSYSRSVGSLDSKMVDIMLQEHHRRTATADNDVDVHQNTGLVPSPPGLGDATKMRADTDFTVRDKQEGMTCNEIEQLRIAQLVRQHDLLNKMDLEQEMLRRRREKRMIDAKLMTKKDKRQPKKRVPMPVYTEPEHVHVPKKITFPKPEHRPVPAVVAPPRPILPAPAAVKPTSAIVAIMPISPSVTISKEVPKQLVAETPSVPSVVVTSPVSVELVSELVDPLNEADEEESTQTAPEPQSSEPFEEHADANEDDVEAVDEDDGADELQGDTISDHDAAHEEEEDESLEATSVGTATTGKRDVLSAAKIRVEAPLVSPSLATALVTPGVEREEEGNREQFELRLMRTNDYAAPNRSKHVPTRPGKTIVEIYYSSSEEEEESDEEKLSEAEKRIRFLKKKLEDAKSGYHPRRVAEEMAGVAFFPMLFSDDLVYNPCSATSGPLVVGNGIGDYVSNADGVSNQDGSPRLLEPDISATDFSDIRRFVQERKALMNKERLQQLYKTSSAIPDEWISVVRKQGVDWEKYMDREKDSRLQHSLTGTGKTRSRPKAGLSPRPITSLAQLRSSGPLPGGHVAAALATIALNVAEGDEPRTSKEDLDAVANAEEDEFFMRRIENHERRLAQNASEPAGFDDLTVVDRKPTALPFGKVVSGICEIDTANYFYVSPIVV